ncbi:MAG: hypothetical protein JNL11_15365 [Bdellovibrionaceae bacterium]|nr:hypothetical protein [Pseudobdellovibrionaceae bacterium]
MLLGPRKWLSKNTQRKPQQSLHDNQFEWNYVLIFACISAFAFALFSIPLIYFFSRNYYFFESIAFNTYPTLIRNLYQEKSWLWGYCVAGGASSFGLILYFGKKFTANTIKPIKKIEDHLQQLMTGNFKDPIIFDSNKSELNSIKINYEYFYRVLRSNTEQELEILCSLNIDQNNRDSLIAWQKLVQTKCKQLGLNYHDIVNAKNQSNVVPISENVFVPKRKTGS